MVKKALVTGITGQDGSYLAELLLKKGYEVHGIMRRSSSFNTGRINHIYQAPQEKRRLNLIFGDLGDASSINHILRTVKPDEIYNLGAQSHVRVSFDIPEYTADVTGLGSLRILEALRENKLDHTKYYQASSSELFGKVQEIPQSEKTPFYPRSPYGCAKIFAYWTTVNYRESYNMFACNGILFNHESPRRGETFVTRKITKGIANILVGKQKTIYLGNLDAKRDWGFAGDYVDAMWRILQQKEPDDYVIATGETHSVREFLEEALRVAGIEAKSNGKKGISEKYTDKRGNVIIEIDKRYFRPAEVDILMGDPSKAKKKLGWEPRTKFRDLVRMMVEADINQLNI
jgi:GDPmannose 4,6-dehydratase